MPSRQHPSDHVPLQVTKPSDIDSRSRTLFGSLVPPWVTAGVIGALGVALGGWLLATGWALALWLSEIDGGISGVLVFGTRIWLAGHGSGLQLGDTLMSVIPLSLTLLNAAGLYAVAYNSARSGHSAESADEPVPPARIMAQTAIATTVTYVAVVSLLALIFVEPIQLARSFGLSLLIAVLASVAGSLAGTNTRLRRAPASSLVRPSRLSGVDERSEEHTRLRPASSLVRPSRLSGVDERSEENWLGLPHWVRWGGRSVMAGLGVLLLVSVSVAVTAAASHWDRISGLSDQLGLPPLPATVLVLGQLAFLPNAVLWAGSYSLGAGITIGTGTQVTVTSTTLGLLPAFPIFGALPQPGIAETGQVFWLVGGAAAGAVAGLLGARSWWREVGSEARVEFAAVTGLVVGVTTALCWVAISALSRGDLGASRLVGIGPRLLELLMYSSGLLGVTGALAGVGYALWKTRSTKEGDPEESRTPD